MKKKMDETAKLPFWQKVIVIIGWSAFIAFIAAIVQQVLNAPH